MSVLPCVRQAHPYSQLLYIHRHCSVQKHNDWRRVVPMIQYKVESGWDEAVYVLPYTNHIAVNKIELSLVLQVQLWWPFLFATFPTLPRRWCRSMWLCGLTQSFQSTQSWKHTSPFHCGISMVLWTHCCSVFPPTHFAGHAGELCASSGLAFGNIRARLGGGRDTPVKKEQVHQLSKWVMINATEKYKESQIQSLRNQLWRMWPGSLFETVIINSWTQLQCVQLHDLG